MYEVSVEASFQAAHFLKHYHGKCENLHGHGYRVLAHGRGTSLDEGGMLLDFSILKSALRAACDSLDHTLLNDNAAFENNPSAERIAHFIFDKVAASLSQQGVDPALLFAVDVYETPTSRARYRAEPSEEA